MVAILKRELSSYFNSAVAYVVMAVYFLFSGLFFSMICIENDTSSLSYVFGNMFIIILFYNSYYHNEELFRGKASAYRPGAHYIAYKPF